MNQKILVVIKIPYLEQELDILIPESKKIGNIKNEIIKTLNEKYPNIFPEPNQLSLYERTTGSILKNDLYVKNHIKNGTNLILM